jgi:GT2 family glycosyltransferase
MTSVSVIIPCYNYGHHLHDAVASVLEDQPGVDVKVLVIDDASTDGSGEVAMRIAREDPRVETLIHDVNRGHIATYNEGLLEWADADYCALLSADDRLTPGALTRATALLDAQPSVAFVYGYALPFHDGEDLPVPRTSDRGWSVWSGPSWIERRFKLARSGISSPEVVVRTALQKRVGGYDPDLPHHGDTEMWMRLALYGDVGYLRGVDQAFYRRHAQNMSTTYTGLKDLHQRLLAFESLLERPGAADVLDAPQLAAAVHRKLAWEALFAVARAYEKGKTGVIPTDELEAFAVECWPDARTMPVYWAVRARKLLGARLSQQLGALAPPERGLRFFSECHYRYDSFTEALEALARPGKRSVRFA